MPLKRVNAMTIFLIVQLTLSIVSSEPVTMYVRQEATSENFVYVNFYKDTFQRMYNCMADMNNKECNAKVENQNSEIPYHPEVPEVPKVNYKVMNVTWTTASTVARGYFTCQINQNLYVFECTRNTTDQFGKSMCTAFRLRNSTRCECVYIMWKYPGEKILYNKTDIKGCKPECTKTTTTYTTDDSTEASSPLNVACTLTSEHSTDATTNSLNIANSGSDSLSSNSVPIIIGVVAGLLVIAIIVFVIIYRRKKQTIASNNDISSSRSPSKPGLTRTNIPDVLTTLPYSHGSETSGDSEDGYYTIDKDCGLNRYENGLNTVSSNTSENPGRQINFRYLNRYANELRFSPQASQVYEGHVNSDLPPTREGDYFTIDTVNNESEDNTTVSGDKGNTGEYSLAKDVTAIDGNPIDVIDVSSPPKNIYSRFGHNEPDVKNPYDVLLQKYEIQNSRKNLDDTSLQGMAEDKDTHSVDAYIGKLSVTSGGSSPAFKPLPDMTRDVDKARGQFPEYSMVSKVGQ